MVQGIITRLAETVSGKITGSQPGSRQASRQNSLGTGRRKSGTELEAFEDAGTHLYRPSDSSEASYRAAEPMAAHQYVLLLCGLLMLQSAACILH